MPRRFCLFSLLFVVLLFSVVPGRSQVFGGTPPSVKWNQLRTREVRVLFPSPLDLRAGQVAALINRLNGDTRATIGGKFRPVTVVFHDGTTVSNAYVQLAPFRSEFQLTTPQNSFSLGSLPWHQLLAIHEYRHVQQFNNFRVGLSRIFYILFGEEGQAFANNLALPNWFWEGDAVFQETLVSGQGRGRLPAFLGAYASLWSAGKNYSWMKLRNGSYRDYTPDHYPLGFMMVAYGRQKFGPAFWDKTAAQTAAFQGLFYPLQQAIRRQTGESFSLYRQQALAWFRDRVPPDTRAGPDADYAAAHRHFQADETFPQWDRTGNLVFERSTYRKPPVFAMREAGDGRAKILHPRAISLDDQFSLGAGKIVYAAYEPDLRWGWVDYSVLRILNVNSGSDRRLTSRTKYFSPDIDSAGKEIVAVDESPAGDAHLDLLDAASGKRVRRLPNPDSLFYTYPKFFGEGKIVSAVRNAGGEMCLMQIDRTTGDQQPLTHWTMAPVGFLSVNGSDLYFTRSEGGSDRGYRLTGEQLSEMRSVPRTGVYMLSGKPGSVVFSGFTAVGRHLNVIRGSDDSLFRAVATAPTDTLADDGLSALHRPPFRLSADIPTVPASTKKYPALTHPFHFHSWRPYVNDPDFQFSLVGENLLNTVQSEIYAGYNRNEQSKSVGADLTYGALFPFLDAGMEFLIDRSGYLRNGTKIFWNEWQPYAGFSVPLSFSRGLWQRTLQLGMNAAYHKRFFRGPYKDSLDDRGYASVDPYVQYVQQVQQAKMQIYPSYAEALLLQFHRSVTTLEGNQLLLSGNFYFPGLVATQTLELRAAFQQRDALNQLRFTNGFPFSRGYSGENFYHMYRLAANYHFPIVYPDAGVANIVYLLRVRANAFYDYTGVPVFAGNGPGVSDRYRSTGLELYFDTSWWNELPLTIGIRYSRLIDRDYEGRAPNQWELILPLNLLDKGFSARHPSL